MSDSKVNIAITTSAQTAGAQAAGKSLADLQKELKATQREMKATDAASPEFVVLKNRTAALKDEIRQLGDTQEKAGGKAANFGNAMLQGSRGIQDFSAAGLPGVVNNLEGLATALGLTAGAAGGITLVAVGLDLLVRNWDKIKTAFGAPEEVKAFWSAITPDEATQRRLEAFNKQLETQAMMYERIAETRKASIESARQEDELLQKRAELWKGITPTPQERGDLPPLPGMEPTSPAMREAQRKLQDAQAGTAASMGKFGSLDAATAEQQRRVAAISQIASFDERLRMANAPDNQRFAELQRQIALSGQGGVINPALIRERDALQQQMQQRRDQMRAEIPNVPGLTDGLTGDPAKDREVLQQRAKQESERLAQLEQQRLAAAQEAERAARAQALAEQGVQGVGTLEAETRGAAAFGDLGLPPAPGLMGGADERGGLTAAIASLQQQQAGNQAASQQLVSVVDSVGKDAATMQQKLAQVMLVLGGSYRAIQADVDGLKAELENYRNANR